MQGQTSTKRALSQVIFRHTPGSLIALDDFNVYVRVKEIKGESDTEVNKELLFKTISRFADKWREDSDGRVKGLEPHLTVNSFVAIRPKGYTPDAPAVFCDLFPPGFQCVKKDCGVYTSPRDSYFNGSCPRCNSSLRQVRYVWFHLCGYLHALEPMRQIRCPQHGQKYLYLNDTGRFATSTWRCRECNSIDRGLGMIPCTSCQLSPEEVQKRQNFLRGSVWNDSWVYYSQTVSFVNLESSRSNDLLTSPNAGDLIVESITGRLEAGGAKLNNRANATIKCVSCKRDISRSSKFCSHCGAKQPSISDGEENAHYDLEGLNLSPDSALVTFATLRDLERTLSAKDITAEATSSGETSAMSITTAVPELIKGGIDDIMLIQDFPLTTAAIGYSRLKSGPPAWLNCFPSTDVSGTRIPVYTNCITSEAWMIKLSALQVIKWLKTNNRMPSDYFSHSIDNEAKATLWLVQRLSKENKSDDDRALYDSTYSLLHSYAHLSLQLLGVHSGLDAGSLGEMLLPEALSFIVYAGEGDIGGLSATFTQSLGLFAADLSDFARVCKFDPSCQNDDGGVCAGCLYTSRGCVDFNNNLSRSYLYGGKANEGDFSINIKTGYLDI